MIKMCPASICALLSGLTVLNSWFVHREQVSFPLTSHPTTLESFSCALPCQLSKNVWIPTPELFSFSYSFHQKTSSGTLVLTLEVTGLTQLTCASKNHWPWQKYFPDHDQILQTRQAANILWQGQRTPGRFCCCSILALDRHIDFLLWQGTRMRRNKKRDISLFRSGRTRLRHKIPKRVLKGINESFANYFGPCNFLAYSACSNAARANWSAKESCGIRGAGLHLFVSDMG